MLLPILNLKLSESSCLSQATMHFMDTASECRPSMRFFPELEPSLGVLQRPPSNHNLLAQGGSGAPGEILAVRPRFTIGAIPRWVCSIGTLSTWMLC